MVRTGQFQTNRTNNNKNQTNRPPKQTRDKNRTGKGQCQTDEPNNGKYGHLMVGRSSGRSIAELALALVRLSRGTRARAKARSR